VREQLRPTLIFLALIWIASIFFFSRMAADETPAEEEAVATEEATNAAVDITNARIAQESGITLALQSNNEEEKVLVGSQVRYTIVIKNEGEETVDPVLTNLLPVDLVLEAASIEASDGTVESEDNAFSWSGTVPQDAEVSITYTAHPNYFSEPEQTLDNVVRLQAEDVNLETAIAIVNERNFFKLPIIGIAQVLDFMAGGLSRVGIPYAFGFAIILFTVAVRAATFPLNKKQIESTKATQELQPKLKELQKKYGDDREKMAQEQMRLYKEHGINPLGGCLPILVQMPIWLSLYRALFHLANDTSSLTEGFLWIPSLSGPVGPIVGGYSGGVDWLFPWSEAFLGWPDALAYLVLPILLVVSQLYMQKTMTPQTNDSQQKMMGQIMMFMPFMFGYFALVVPAGLSVYWITSNLLGIVQQNYMMKARAELEATEADPEAKQELAKNSKLEVSPATATVENSSDSKEQVNADARRRRSRSKKRRKRKK